MWKIRLCLICFFFLYCLMLKLFLGIIFYKLFQNKVQSYSELNILHRICQIYFEKKSTAWVLFRIKEETIVSYKKTYFRMEIFLRKVANYTDLGKYLFWIEVHFHLELGVDLTVYHIPLNNLLIICWVISLMWATVKY